MLILSNPLHSLRKTKLFQRLLTTRLNNPKLYDLGFEHSVALRPLTHASIIWRNENLESNIRRLTKSVVQHLDRSGDHGSFIDVGANIGMYSWEVFKNSPKRKILAFEPDPLNFELLETTLGEYDFGNMEILEICRFWRYADSVDVQILGIANSGDCNSWRYASSGDCRFWRLQILEIADS